MVITINREKCLGADKCGKCMENCPLGVFANFPIDEFIHGRMPEKYAIFPTFQGLCNGCMICTNICPEKCIDIKI